MIDRVSAVYTVEQGQVKQIKSEIKQQQQQHNSQTFIPAITLFIFFLSNALNVTIITRILDQH